MQDLDKIILGGITVYQAYTLYSAIKTSNELSRFLEREERNKEITLEKALKQDIYD